jgi:hypothetical protein
MFSVKIKKNYSNIDLANNLITNGKISKSTGV